MRRRRPLKPPTAHKPWSFPEPPKPSRRTAAGLLALLTAAFALAALYSNYGQGSRQPTEKRSGPDPTVKTDLPKMAPVYKVSVLEKYPHDRNAFTQGLTFGPDGHMYESTGYNGRSSVRRVVTSTGDVETLHSLPFSDFGEGLTLAPGDDNRLIQVLWKAGGGYIYDRKTLFPLANLTHSGDAWGITRISENDPRLLLSDGTAKLRFMKLQDNALQPLESVFVHDGPHQVGMLNELEIIDGELWANVFMSDFIARIDIDTGVVNSWVDCRGILSRADIPPKHKVDVLNGIAHDDQSGATYLTGKLWPTMYSIAVSDEKVADSITDVTDAFFLDPKRIEYILNYMLA